MQGENIEYKPPSMGQGTQAEILGGFSWAFPLHVVPWIQLPYPLSSLSRPFIALFIPSLTWCHPSLWWCKHEVNIFPGWNCLIEGDQPFLKGQNQDITVLSILFSLWLFLICIFWLYPGKDLLDFRFFNGITGLKWIHLLVIYNYIDFRIYAPKELCQSPRPLNIIFQQI